MKEKNEVEEAVNNYVRLQEREKEIKGLIAYWREQLMKTIKEQQGLPIVTGDKQIALRTRSFYEYDPEAISKTVWGEQYGVLKTVVDKDRIKTLIKEGLLTNKALAPLRKLVKTTTALVVEAVKREEI